jgi:transposase
METIPTTSRSLDRYYHINGDTFEKQYKEVLSGYREWSELSHAEDWLVFPENIGESICIDETAPSNGELYTIVSNRSSRGGKGTIIAIVKGVAADAVTEALMRIDEDKRLLVKEITMDMSNSMRLIARRCFPNAMRTIDRFHIQKLACDALQEMRIAHRWDAIQADTDAREEAKCLGEAYTPIVLANGDTHKQLLARSRYLLFKSADKWTESQRQRAEVLFETYPDLKEAYSLTHSLRMIFSKNTVKDAARLSLARWYNKVDDSGFKSFNVIAATLYEHYDEVLNFFVNRATNAFAESFNAKIKAFRAALRGVTDIKFSFFIFYFQRIVGQCDNGPSHDISIDMNRERLSRFFIRISERIRVCGACACPTHQFCGGNLVCFCVDSGSIRIECDVSTFSHIPGLNKLGRNVSDVFILVTA